MEGIIMIVMKCKIFDIGDNFLEIKEANAMIMFGKDAPQDLLKYCVIIDSLTINKDVQKGMKLFIGNQVYCITAVGNHVNNTLKTLGHATIYFDGSFEPKLPGCLHVERKSYPEISIGDDVYIDE